MPIRPAPSSDIEIGSGTAVAAVLALLVNVKFTSVDMPFCELVASENMPVVASAAIPSVNVALPVTVMLVPSGERRAGQGRVREVHHQVAASEAQERVSHVRIGSGAERNVGNTGHGQSGKAAGRIPNESRAIGAVTIADTTASCTEIQTGRGRGSATDVGAGERGQRERASDRCSRRSANSADGEERGENGVLDHGLYF